MSNSRLAPALVLGALLAAINLAAGMTAVAHAQTTRQPPTQGQVGEPRHPRVSPPAPQPSRTANPGGRSHRWPCWPPRWRCPAAWPPGEQAARLGLD
jgi:hypothetical protein